MVREELSMSISATLLPEFDHEMAGTRRELERIPEDKFGWKPHEKSMTLGRLSAHLAEIPSWGSETIAKDSLDMAPPGAPPYKPPVYTKREEILAVFDKNVKAAREALAEATDEHLMGGWTLLMGGNKLFTLPRAAVLRTWVLNHNVHHRAQLGVYLRLNEIAVPAIYGPSADEQGM
jgi:uncharacterized damage-inducible protein DinB